MPDEAPNLPTYNDVAHESERPFDEHAGKMVGPFIKMGKAMGKQVFKGKGLRMKTPKLKHKKHK